MPALIVPAVMVIVALLLLVFIWRLAREGRRRFEYWKQVLSHWRNMPRR